MTSITICKDKSGSYKKLICEGHAAFSYKGSDIVCASVSVLLINTLNVLEELAHETMKEECNEKDGIIICEFISPLQERSIFLLDAMVYGIQNIEKEYGKKYVKVNFKEV